MNSSLRRQSKQDSLPHILVCESYRYLQEPGFDKNDDKMLAEFFIKVVNRRIEREEMTNDCNNYIILARHYLVATWIAFIIQTPMNKSIFVKVKSQNKSFDSVLDVSPAPEPRHPPPPLATGGTTLGSRG